MGALIVLFLFLFSFGAVYPAAAIVYYKLIKHSKMTIFEIFNII